MHYTLTKDGPASAPTFTLFRNNAPIARGPVDPGQYAQELDAAARLCAFANVAISLADAVEKTQEIANLQMLIPRA